MDEHWVPSSLIFPLSSTGVAITGLAPSALHRYPIEMLPKSVRRKADVISGRPSCVFVVIDMSRDQIDSGISIARRSEAQRIAEDRCC
jgi:hypothetical protein